MPSKIYIHLSLLSVAGEKAFKGGSKIRFRRSATLFRHITRLASELNAKPGSRIKDNFNFFWKSTIIDNWICNRIFLGHSLHLRSGKKKSLDVDRQTFQELFKSFDTNKDRNIDSIVNTHVYVITWLGAKRVKCYHVIRLKTQLFLFMLIVVFIWKKPGWEETKIFRNRISCRGENPLQRIRCKFSQQLV